MFRLRIPQRILLPMLVALVAVLATPSAFAQTTGALRGEVVDDDGLPIPSVAVTISSDKLIGGNQERVTESDGSFHFVELPPGLYELIAQKAGFQTISMAGIQVKVNRVTRQQLVMPLGENAEVIDVVATRNAVEVDNTTTGSVLTKDFLERIPAGRTYQSAVQMVAGVQAGTGGNPNIGGASYNENTYMLDGAVITDPVTGTFSVNFNYDAIEQIEVLLGGYEAEYGISLGGIVNLVTRTGTNNLEFETAVFYSNGNWRPKMDARFAADGVQLAPPGFDDEYQTLTISALVAGPLVRDRAWFILDYSMASSVIANTGVPQARKYIGQYVRSKLTVQPNAEHRMNVTLQLDPTTIDNIDQGSAFQRAESQGRQVQGGYVINGQWQWFLSPDVNIDTRIVVQKSFIELNSVPCTHNKNQNEHLCEPGEIEGNVDWETPGRFGIEPAPDTVNDEFFYFDDRLRYTASTKWQFLSLQDPLGGTHDVKVGVGFDQTVWDMIQGYNGNLYYVDLYESGFDPDTFVNYYWLEVSGPIKFRTSGSVWNWFIQDSWKPVKNLTIKPGIRYDYSVMRDDLGNPTISGSLWGPRLHGSWDPFGKGKTKIAGGYGRYNDTANLGVASFTSAASYGSKLFLGEYFQGGLTTDGGRTDGYLNNQSVMYDYGPRENLNESNDALKMPTVDEFILMLEQEIIDDVALGGHLTAKYTRTLFEFDETNVIYDEDGSAIIGSRYADPLVNRYRIRTPTLAKRDYYRADFFLRKVPSHRWGGEVTYSYASSIGSSSTSLSGSFANDPQTQYNYGPMFTDVEHTVRGYIYWDLPTDPWTQQVSAFFVYQSGEPLERYYYSEANFGNSLRIRDRGYYYHFNPWWELSVRFAQEFDVRKGKLSVELQAINVTNNRAPWGISSFLYTQNRLLATSRQEPLKLMLGLKYIF